MKYNINLTLPPLETDLLARAVAELPWRVANPILIDIQRQVSEQNATAVQEPAGEGGAASP